jgi:hypothetical protein
MAKKKEKTFTWADLKRVANRMSKERLKDSVLIWTDREISDN